MDGISPGSYSTRMTNFGKPWGDVTSVSLICNPYNLIRDRIITETNLNAALDAEVISSISLNFSAKDGIEMKYQINVRVLVLAKSSHPDAPACCIPCPQH